MRCLLFDVGGSVFDWQSAIADAFRRSSLGAGSDVAPEAFATTWRRRSLVLMYEIAEERRVWEPFDVFVDAALTESLDECELGAVTDRDRRMLTDAWSAMPAWPEVPAAVDRLRSAFLVLPHTILSLAAVARSSKAAGLTWDGIITCDALGVTKTSRESYVRAARVVGFAPDEIGYVAAHASDLRVVRDLGMATAFVESRLDEYGEPPEEIEAGEFDVIATDYADLADRLA